MSLYIETLIRAPMAALWSHTQQPVPHARWDLRFSSIEYSPKPDESASQRFLYTTRIGFGLAVAGEGESVGQRDLPDGSRSSALRFWSDSPLSIIANGSGYWKYVPVPEGVAFITRYDYETRFGWAGRAFDRTVFRPLIGWATAWSFDRLRLWLETGLPPEQARRNGFVHALARGSLAAVFVYHGLVPKLLGQHPSETAMLHDAGVQASLIGPLLIAFGVGEVLFGAALLVAWLYRWPLAVSIIAMAVATTSVALHSPTTFMAAFNPFSLNLLVAAVAAMDWLVLDAVPSARRCRRATR